MKLTLVTVYWGPWHKGIFLNGCLPSLKAPNNLPAMRDFYDDVEWHIWTDSPVEIDIPGIKVVFHDVFEGVSLERRYAWQDKHWKSGKAIAKERGGHIYFIGPDQIWSENFYLNIAEALSNGKHAVITNGPRVLESCLEDLYYNDGVIKAGGSTLIQAAMDHIHPLMDAHSLDSENACTWPELAVLRCNPDVWISHCFGHETMAWNMEAMSVNKYWYPADGSDSRRIWVPQHSGLLTFISVAPNEHFQQNVKPRKLSPEDVAKFWRMHPSKINREIVDYPLIWSNGVGNDQNVLECVERFEAFIEASKEAYYNFRRDIHNLQRRKKL